MPDLPDLPERPDPTSLSDLFQDAVADVEPRPGLDRIRRRTSRASSRRSAWYVAGGVLATAATVTAGFVLLSPTRGPARSPARPPRPARRPRPLPLPRATRRRP